MHTIDSTAHTRLAPAPPPVARLRHDRAPMPASWLCLAGAVLFALLFVLTFVAGATAAS